MKICILLIGKKVCISVLKQEDCSGRGSSSGGNDYKEANQLPSATVQHWSYNTQPSVQPNIMGKAMEKLVRWGEFLLRLTRSSWVSSFSVYSYTYSLHRNTTGEIPEHLSLDIKKQSFSAILHRLLLCKQAKNKITYKTMT